MRKKTAYYQAFLEEEQLFHLGGERSEGRLLAMAVTDLILLTFSWGKQQNPFKDAHSYKTPLTDELPCISQPYSVGTVVKKKCCLARACSEST